jgi:hypothetical protein
MASIRARSAFCSVAGCFALMLLAAFLQQCGGEMPTEYRKFFALPSYEQEARFKEFPLEKQVDVYVHAMYIEPPRTEYRRYLARNRKRVIPVILARLDVEKSDAVKANLISVLTEMHEYQVSLRNEGKTIEALERIVANMSDDYNKRKAREYLDAIKNTPGVAQ